MARRARRRPAAAALPVPGRPGRDPGIDAGARRELVRQGRLLSPVEMYRRARAILDVDLTHRLAEVRAPVLLVHGTRDHVISLRAARRLADALPGCRYVELHGAGHVPYLSHPEPFNELVAGFLDEVFSAP